LNLTPSQMSDLNTMFRKRGNITLKRACEWLAIDTDTFYRYNKLGVFVSISDLLGQYSGGHYRISKECLIAIYELVTTQKLPKQSRRKDHREPESMTFPGFPEK